MSLLANPVWTFDKNVGIVDPLSDHAFLILILHGPLILMVQESQTANIGKVANFHAPVFNFPVNMMGVDQSWPESGVYIYRGVRYRWWKTFHDRFSEFDPYTTRSTHS